VSDTTLVDITALGEDTAEENSGLDLTADPAVFMADNMPKVQEAFDWATTNAQVQFITNMVGTAIQLSAQHAGERIQLEAQAKLREAQEAQHGLATATVLPGLNRAQRRSLR